MTTMIWNQGPFYMRRLPYRLGFDWQCEYELQPGWSKPTWDVPKWAVGTGADVIGEWLPLRYRLCWQGIPISRWRKERPKFRSHKKKRRNV